MNIKFNNIGFKIFGIFVNIEEVQIFDASIIDIIKILWTFHKIKKEEKKIK